MSTSDGNTSAGLMVASGVINLLFAAAIAVLVFFTTIFTFGLGIFLVIWPLAIFALSVVEIGVGLAAMSNGKAPTQVAGIVFGVISFFMGNWVSAALEVGSALTAPSQKQLR